MKAIRQKHVICQQVDRKSKLIKCTVIQFPNRNPVSLPVHKTPSMSCCKTDMIDWNFDRGVY